MEDQTICVAFYTALQKSVVRFSAAVHYERASALFTAPDEEKRILLVKGFRHIEQKIKCESVDVNELFFIREYESADSLFLFNEFSCPFNGDVGINILRF